MRSKHKTRLDRFHAMDAEPLAELLLKIEDEPEYCTGTTGMCFGKTCKECIVEWLHEEVDEE